jgi:hypothetical protein
MVTHRHVRTSLVFLLISLVAACSDRIPNGWRTISVEDVRYTQMLRAIHCGEKLSFGLMVNENVLSKEDMGLIDALPIERRLGTLLVVRTDAPSLASVFSVEGVSVAVDDETLRSLRPLVDPKMPTVDESTAVILDLPDEKFSENLDVLRKRLRGEETAGLRTMALTRQVSVQLSQESLQRIEALSSVCAVYPDETLAPIGGGGSVPSK